MVLGFDAVRNAADVLISRICKIEDDMLYSSFVYIDLCKSTHFSQHRNDSTQHLCPDCKCNCPDAQAVRLKALLASRELLV